MGLGQFSKMPISRVFLGGAVLLLAAASFPNPPSPAPVRYEVIFAATGDALSTPCTELATYGGDTLTGILAGNEPPEAGETSTMSGCCIE
jgi:hypothetical protein